MISSTGDHDTEAIIKQSPWLCFFFDLNIYIGLHNLNHITKRRAKTDEVFSFLILEGFKTHQGWAGQ
jgi:hypothetical protein